MQILQIINGYSVLKSNAIDHSLSYTSVVSFEDSYPIPRIQYNDWGIPVNI